MRRTIHLLVGCPGAGKTWVADRLKDEYEVVSHDNYGSMASERYVEAIRDAAVSATRPILVETPFSVSRIKEPLEAAGCDVRPVYIQEKFEVIAERYQAREGRPIPQGHLTRQGSYLEMAKTSGGFVGTNEEVLDHLKRLADETDQDEASL